MQEKASGTAQPPVTQQYSAAKVMPARPAPSEQKVVHKLPESNLSKMKSIIIGLIVIVAGIGTGYLLSGAKAQTGGPTPTSNVAQDNAPQVNEEVFSDKSIGILHQGGIEGEGTHYLDTGAGKEKYVYLLSTVLDLDSFVGKKVEVQGQTLAAEHAGWLMDVGKIKEVK